jgi:ribosomal protein S18 acetylase RimI-like enzyme
VPARGDGDASRLGAVAVASRPTGRSGAAPATVCRMDSAYRVTEFRDVSEDLASALDTLVPQLSNSSPAPTRDEWQAIASAEATRLLVAETAEGRAVGMLTLAVFTIPTGVRAWIEDVVVDEGVRGGGVGALLVRRALDLASDAGARTVDLTSRPSREAANRLYQRLGFELRQTNVYRFAAPQD